MTKQMRSLAIAAAVVILGIAAVVLLTMSKPDSTDDSMKMSDSKTVAVPTDAVATNAVSIDDFKFGPATITVKAGTTVTWTNNDDVNHSVTADTASSDAPDSKLFKKEETVSFTFMKAGTYPYHCTPHPNMKGTVVVTE